LTTNRPYRTRYTREEAIDLMRSEAGRTFDPDIVERFVSIIDKIDQDLSALEARPLSLIGVASAYSDRVIEQSFSLTPATPSEQPLRDIAAAQSEVLSLYEISQALGSTLKLSEVLPIVATKLENIADFTTLVISLAEGNKLRAAHVIGKNADALKGMEMALSEGGAGWVGEHRE